MTSSPFKSQPPFALTAYLFAEEIREVQQHARPVGGRRLVVAGFLAALQFLSLCLHPPEESVVTAAAFDETRVHGGLLAVFYDVRLLDRSLFDS